MKTPEEVFRASLHPSWFAPYKGWTEESPRWYWSWKSHWCSEWDWIGWLYERDCIVGVRRF